MTFIYSVLKRVIPVDTHCKLSQTNSFWILVQLQARQAQLKRRLAVIERRGGSAGGWRRSIYQRWKKPCTHFSRVPQGEGKGDKRAWISCVFTGAASSPVCGKLQCFAVLSEALYVLQFYSAIKGAPPPPPPPPPPSGGLSSALTVTPRSHRCKHAHWAISQGSLTRGCLLLRDEFSWPINYFLPGRT